MMTSRSQNIPIARSRYHIILEQRYVQEERAAMLQADYDDYVFYRRIVGGIEKTQETTQCNKLRDQNQELIDHLHYIRHASYTKTTTAGTSPPIRIYSSYSSKPQHHHHHSRRWNLLPKDSVPYGYSWDDADDNSATSSNMPSRTNSFESADDDETLMFELDL